MNLCEVWKQLRFDPLDDMLKRPERLTSLAGKETWVDYFRRFCGDDVAAMVAMEYDRLQQELLRPSVGFGLPPWPDHQVPAALEWTCHAYLGQRFVSLYLSRLQYVKESGVHDVPYDYLAKLTRNQRSRYTYFCSWLQRYQYLLRNVLRDKRASLRSR